MNRKNFLAAATHRRCKTVRWVSLKLDINYYAIIIDLERERRVDCNVDVRHHAAVHL
jgi:hypothetical protein